MSLSKAFEDPSIHAADEILRQLGSDRDRGLSSSDAAQRLAAHGPNKLRASGALPGWRRLLNQFQDPLVYLLFAAAGIAALVWFAEGSRGVPVDAMVVTVVVVANAVLGYLQETRAANAVAALARMIEATSSVVRNGQRQRISSSDLVPGDLLILEEGDAVGADARLLQAASLKVQEASLTGESEPVLKAAAALARPAPLAERSCMVFKGTSVTQGSARAVVTATGMETEVGSIASMLEATREDPTPLQREVAHIGRVLGIAVIALAIVVVAVVLALSDIRSVRDVMTVLMFGVSLAVAAVPEGLPAILSLVLALGVQRMAKRNAIVRNLSSVETLGSASVICTDKTGTLTRSEMTIERIVTTSGASRVGGVGYSPVGVIETEARAPLSGSLLAEQIVVLSGGSLASNADLHQRDQGQWEIEGDPTEAAFLVAERKLGVADRRRQRFERITTIPFSSDRKLMSTIERDHEHGDMLVLITKGAPEVLIDRCTQVRVGMDVLPLDRVLRARAMSDVERLSNEALRTLAVGYRPLSENEMLFPDESLEHNLIFVGTVGIIDPPREEASIAIRDAHRAGVRVIMITGDHPRTAARIAARLGIAGTGAALTGQDIDQLDDTAFAAAIEQVSVFARVAPAHKLRIVDTLQAGGHIVAMTGDGVNDAPALKSADVGVAMGITGTQVTKEAAKMILADDNFATIVSAIREGRVIFENIRKFLRYLLSSNVGEVLTVFLGVTGAGVIGLVQPGSGEAVVLPLLASQILWINLITDSGPALAMGVDRETGDVMARPPRGRSDRAIDGRMWLDVIVIGLAMAFAALATIDLYLPGGLLEGNRTLDEARTAGFTVLVFAQLFNCLNARSETQSAFRHLFANAWLWAAIALALVLQVAVVHLEWMNPAFGTTPLSLEQWAACVGMGSVVLWVSEIRKWGYRLWSRRSAAAR